MNKYKFIDIQDQLLYHAFDFMSLCNILMWTPQELSLCRRVMKQKNLNVHLLAAMPEECGVTCTEYEVAWNY